MDVKPRLVRLVIGLMLSTGVAVGKDTIHWKAVLVAGDDSIDVFDNARDEVGRLLVLSGLEPQDVIDLSFSQTDPNGAIWPASLENLRLALLRLKVHEGDGCLLHLTSHGSPEGFFLGDDPVITPRVLSALLDEACARVPTVILVSACYSGIFTSPVMRRPNRVILTAARADRSSFGCDAESEYTFWDDCLIQSYRPGRSWVDIYAGINACIIEKENQEREQRSFPQDFFGGKVRALRAPALGWRLSHPSRLYEWLWGEDSACYLDAKIPDETELSCL